MFQRRKKQKWNLVKKYVSGLTTAFMIFGSMPIQGLAAIQEPVLEEATEVTASEEISELTVTDYLEASDENEDLTPEE